MYYTTLMKGITFLLLFLGSFVQAQDVRINGYIKDENTGENLIGANIYVDSLNIGVSSNVYGYFSLKLPKGVHKLSISFIGYQDLVKSIKAYENQNLSFQLREEAGVLSEITLSDTDSEKNLVKMNNLGQVKLKMIELNKLPTPLGEGDILKSLLNVPGVSQAREGGNGINIRGGNIDQNLILLDGTTVFNSAHLFGFFSIFNSDVIKNTTLYKGGIPVRFGGRLSSVLDVQQKEGNLKKFSAQGGVGVLASRLMLEGPIVKEKASFMIAGRRSYGDLFLKLSDEEQLKNSALYFYDLNTKANWQINDHNRLFLSAYFGKDIFGFKDNFEIGWGNTNFALRWNHIYGPKLFGHANIIYSNYAYRFDIDSYLKWDAQTTDWTFKKHFEYSVDNEKEVQFGLEMSKYRFNLGDIRYHRDGVDDKSLGVQNGYQAALYSEYNWDFSSLLSLSFGLRALGYFNVGAQWVNQYENDQAVIWDSSLRTYREGKKIGSKYYQANELVNSHIGILPRLKLSYSLSENQSLKLSYQRTMQNIHLITNATSSNPLNIWIPNSPYIKPSFADQISAGYFYQINESSSFSVESYYKSMDNLIDYIDLPSLVQNSHLETEILQMDGRSFGMELMFKKDIGKLSGWLSYTLSKTDLKFNGLGGADEDKISQGNWYPASFDKRHNLNLVGIYELNERWTISANFALSSGVPVNYPVHRFTLFGQDFNHFSSLRNQNRLPLYHRLDIGATLKGKPKKWGAIEWVFGIYNVYNRHNTASLRFVQASNGMDEVESMAYFGVIPSVSWNFKIK